ncbi:class I SAM-dependent methyltransferase [Methyloterricola oryzae]|uniref:class I SAM-dependent methyltransferase n=1 Tax=Methyloterricola oryzae TaxID=1495050 RepID=UPI00069A588A|nr:class I SAM-dependent methyltransferase [Methyloterricola oryzae]
MQVNELIQWKTQAWKDPQMVAWYDQRMRDESGINRLKNHIEIRLCSALAAGEELLDVGTGTGRASIPLARQGFKVSAVDSSQAMLKQCALLAGDLKMEFKVADVATLPFRAGRFNTVMGLNVLVHFPHVDSVLREWQRVCKPGGRLFFDLLSKDHYCAAHGISEPEADRQLNNVQFDRYNMALSSRDVVNLADSLGLSIVSVIPYGFFIMGYPNYWLEKTLERTHSWKRFLGLLKSDDSLFNFAAFIDANLVNLLPPLAAPRIMIAFDNKPDRDGNQAWFERWSNFQREAATREIDLAFLRSRIPTLDENWRRELNGHLRHPRNLVFLYQTFETLRLVLPSLNLEGLIDGEWLSTLESWRRQDAADRQLMDFCRNWPAGTGAATALDFAGIPLAPGFEYALMNRLVACYNVRKADAL